MRGHFNETQTVSAVSLVLQSQSEWRNKTRGFGLVPGGDEGQDRTGPGNRGLVVPKSTTLLGRRSCKIEPYLPSFSFPGSPPVQPTSPHFRAVSTTPGPLCQQL